jgi:SAM-dependent methyltransferase
VSASAVACRSCAHTPLTHVLSLGTTPLANQLLTEQQFERPEPRYPLDLAFCERCALVQITQTIAPEELFSDYVYFSSFSVSMLEHSKDLASRIASERRMGPTDLVVEIASNDGYLLQYYKELGVSVLGIEPARNIAQVARDRGIPTVSEFFGENLADRLRSEGKRAAVVHANNVMAHVPDINGFAAALSTIMADDGIALIEVPYVREMIGRCEFDTIYHEHVFYFSLTSLSSLFARNGLQVVDVELIALHGGSLLLRIAKEAAMIPVGPRVADMLREETDLGMGSIAYYRGFSSQVQAVRDELCRALCDLKSKGHRLAAYGAAAKGSTLLNYAGIGTEILDFVVDRSPHKQGKFMPGIRLPIRPPSALLEERPDYVLLLTWNFKDEILTQQDEYRKAGGKFIIPLPSISIE